MIFKKLIHKSSDPQDKNPSNSNEIHYLFFVGSAVHKKQGSFLYTDEYEKQRNKE